MPGSRPRTHRPGIRVNAQPGGGTAFGPDWTVASDYEQRSRKFFPEGGGAGANRDKGAIEALRYYQDSDEGLGRVRMEGGQHRVEPRARDMHRYHHDEPTGRARGDHGGQGAFAPSRQPPEFEGGFEGHRGELPMRGDCARQEPWDCDSTVYHDSDRGVVPSSGSGSSMRPFSRSGGAGF